MTISELNQLLYDWALWARDDQLPPADTRPPWTCWLLLGGRGAGKTRAGAEWIRAQAKGDAPGRGRLALIAQTYADAREVMVEGPSGLLAVHDPRSRPKFESSRRRIEWPNGAVAHLFSAEDPERLRGPQFDAAWCDEFCKWRYGRETWDMLQFALRIGPNPRQVVTTTPRPIKLLKELIAAPGTVVSRSKTAANKANLSASFLTHIVNQYRGTRLGRQELDAEILEDRTDTLWRRTALEQARRKITPPLARIVVAVDPPVSSTRHADACGIICAGLDREGIGYLLEDATLQRASPLEWAARAAELYHRHGADRLVAEVNQGGEMVAAIIGQVDRSVAVKMVRASRGKWLRAEPVAALYEQGRVRHVGAFPELEDEMCEFTASGLPGGASPDRLDALVWALSELMLGRAVQTPRIRDI